MIQILKAVNKINHIGVVRRFVFWSLIVFYGLLTYWMLWPYDPITIKSPIEIMNTNKTVKAGETLVYKLDLDKKMPLPCVITKQLTDGVVITCAPIIGNVKVGKSAKNYPLKIPSYMDSGMNIMKWSGSYKVNPIRWVTVVAYSEPFFILSEQPEIK